jgi:hypothetical protein
MPLIPASIHGGKLSRRRDSSRDILCGTRRAPVRVFDTLAGEDPPAHRDIEDASSFTVNITVRPEG